MNRILNFADKATKYGLVASLVIFAVACIFSGCGVPDSVDFAPDDEVPETFLNFYAETTATKETKQSEDKPRFLDMGDFELTAYCSCDKCCGKWSDGCTATGTNPVQGRTIAVDEDVIPYGSEVIINGHTYIAEDCGGSIVGQKIDIYFDSHEEAERFGVQSGHVILKVGDTDDTL